MLLELFLSLLLVLLAAAVNYCWVSPKKLFKFYENQLKSTNYKVKYLPYNLKYNGLIDPINQGIKVGDPYKVYKQEYPNYDVVLSNVFNKIVIELNSVDFINDFYAVDKHYDYPKIKPVMTPFKRLVGMGIGFAEGQLWKKKRTILNSVLNFEFLKSQIPNITKICDTCFEEMQKKATKKQGQEGTYVEVDMLEDLMTKIFSTIILSSFFGIQEKHYIQGEEACDYLNKILIDLMKYQVQSVTTFLGDWFYDLQLRSIDKSINNREKILKEWGHKVVKEEIKRLQKQIDQEDNNSKTVGNIIKAILLYKKKHQLSDDNQLVCQDEIFSHFIGFFLGGTDTTSHYTNMMVCYIAKYPEVERKIRQQVEKYMKEDDFSMQNLRNFKYIQALQKETTRVYGPGNVILLREAAKDNYINGLAIKKGTLVTITPYANHFSEKYFKDPFEFRPQRWLNGQCEGINPFVVVGFSAGARTCIGKHLALLQSKITLIKLMKRYKKISIPNTNFKYEFKFMQCPQSFETKFVIRQ